jgi:hypothetical protein
MGRWCLSRLGLAEPRTRGFTSATAILPFCPSGGLSCFWLSTPWPPLLLRRIFDNGGEEREAEGHPQTPGRRSPPAPPFHSRARGKPRRAMLRHGREGRQRCVSEPCSQPPVPHSWGGIEESGDTPDPGRKRPVPLSNCRIGACPLCTPSGVARPYTANPKPPAGRNSCTLQGLPWVPRALAVAPIAES